MRNTKLFVIALIIAAICGGAYYFSEILTLFFVAALIAFLLNPLAHGFMDRFHIKKGFAILIVFLIFLLFIAIILSTLVPMLVEQIRMFVNGMTSYTQNIDRYYNMLLEELSRHEIPDSYLSSVKDFMSSIVGYFTNALGVLLSVLLTSTTRILDVLIVITVAVYFMLDTRLILEKAAGLFPEKTGNKLLALVRESNDMLWNYLKSKTLISCGMALTTFIIFKVIGVQYAPLLAILAFFLDFIPYFGSIIAGCVAALTAFLTAGLSQALITGLCVLVVQQIEGNIVNPKIQGDSVGLHPIAVMFAVLACNQLWGPLGMFMAVPLGGVIKIFLREIYHFLMTPDKVLALESEELSNISYRKEDKT